LGVSIVSWFAWSQNIDKSWDLIGVVGGRVSLTKS
jgi:hypothetical protein